MQRKMKELEDKLKKDSRALSWFWINYITKDICTYQHFTTVVNGRSNSNTKTGRKIKDIVNEYIKDKNE